MWWGHLRDPSGDKRRWYCRRQPLSRAVLCCFLYFAISCGVLSSALGNNPHFYQGRSVIVQLFEWRWEDIALECEQFLGPNGYGGVQVSPPNENAISFHRTRIGEPFRTWDERYQPVSYNLASYSGTAEEFRDMVKRCNSSGIRVYVDAVFNHMTENLGEGTGCAGSRFNGETLSYPSVPYDVAQFNSKDKCGTNSGEIEDFTNVNQVRNCRSRGRADLDQSQESVQSRISEYLNSLITMGVAGFRIDSAAHMWPTELAAIYSKLSHLSPDYFPPGSDPFIDQEIFDPIFSHNYKEHGVVADRTFATTLAHVFQKVNLLELRQLRNFTRPSPDVSGHLIFIDDHETQRRVGVANPKQDVLTHESKALYLLANLFMLSLPHGLIRIMSSYSLQREVEDPLYNRMVGPPSSERFFETLPVLSGNFTDNQFQCVDGWVCEHRWPEIKAMVRFRQVVGDAELTHWWDNGQDAIAFARFRKGFVVINNGRETVNEIFNTTLPRGYYCNVLLGIDETREHPCKGKVMYQIWEGGYGRILVGSSWEPSAVVLHVNARIVESYLKDPGTTNKTIVVSTKKPFA